MITTEWQIAPVFCSGFQHRTILIGVVKPGDPRRGVMTARRRRRDANDILPAGGWTETRQCHQVLVLFERHPQQLTRSTEVGIVIDDLGVRILEESPVTI